MKINNLDTRVFIEKLEMVGNSISNKSSNNTLLGVKINVMEDKITLIGTDIESAIKTTILKEELNSNSIAEIGTCLVDYKNFYTLISKLKCNKINLYTKDDKQLIVTNEDNVYKFNLISMEEYPNIEFKKLDNELEITTEELKKMIDKISYCCSTKENKPILTGVNVKSNGTDNIECTATDSYHLARYTIDCKTTNSFDLTIGKKSIVAINKLANKTKQEKIKILYNNSNTDLMINIDNTLFKTRLLEGRYPDTDRIVNISGLYDYCINKNAFIESIDRISTFSNTNDDVIKNSIIILSFEKSNLTIECENQGKGQAKENIKVECLDSTESMKLACNGIFLMEALKKFNNAEIRITIADFNRPFLITSDDENNNKQIVLPVKMQ